MKTLGWYARRLSKMSAAEILGRSRDAAIKQAWRVKALRPRAPARPHFPLTARPFDPAALSIAPEARAALIAEAHRILGGRVTILGHETALLGEQPDWFSCIRTGRRAPARLYCFDIPYRDAERVGEIKYVWEPSRHHHLTILAAAHALTGEAAFAERVAQHLTSWWRKNPFLTGVHWTSGIEIGIRLISWVWLRRLLAGWPGVSALFEDNPLFVTALFHHQAWLAALPSRGSSANNHLVAEVAGLFAAASAFPIFRQSAQWRRMAALGMERQVEAQTFADGLNRELASSYHALTLELFLVAALEDDPAQPLLGDRVWHGLAAMMDALASFLDAGGKPPRQGDDDGAFALLLDGAGFDRWGSLLNTGRALFGPCRWWPPHGETADVRSACLTALGGAKPAGKRAPQRRSHFVEGGMVLLRDPLPGADELWVRCDHGPLGFLATAAHGHADALSVELRHGGVEVLCDPGTYCYHGHDPWRAYFRSTIGHNTLEVDGQDQCAAHGLFMWGDAPRSVLEHLSGLDKGDIAEWQACHHGYHRLECPATHRRRVTLDRAGRIVEITDWLDSAAAQHDARLAFHLGPSVECRLSGSSARLTWPGHGARMDLPPQLEWTLHRGEEQPILGWYSPSFGLRQPTWTLLGAGRVGAGALTTRLAFMPEPEGTGARAQANEDENERV